MTKKIILTLCMLLCISNLFAFDIVKAGKPVCEVVLAKDANEADKYACDEFVKYVKQMTGADLKVVEESTKNNVFIGQRSASQLLTKANWNNFKKDETFIYSDGKNLVLAGGTGSAVIYSVYTFLEDFCGVKYLTNEEEYIPNIKDISVDKVNKKYISPFMMRETFFNQFNTDPNYCLKLKMNGHHNNVPAELGGHLQIYGFAHTFDRLISKDKYGKDHPDWFAYRDGKRLNQTYSQLCLSNEGMIQELIKNVLKTIEEHPNEKIYSCTQNDNQLYCQCDACKALSEKYGHSGALLTVINRIADAVKAKYPDKLVETFAYNYTRTAPKNIVPRDNVLIRLCSIEADFAKPFDDPINEDFYTNITNWSKISKQLFIWDYTVNFTNYVILHPNFNVLQKNLQLMRDNKAIGVFEQGDSFNKNACLQNYKKYIIAKLVWNPDINFREETETFFKLYYGPASKDMLGFLDYVNEIATREFELKTYMGDNFYLTVEDWIACFNYLQNALKSVEGTEYYDKVKMDLLCFEAGYVFANREISNEVKSKVNLIYDGMGFLNEINEFAPKNGLTHYAEGKAWKDGPYYAANVTTKTGKKPAEVEGLKDSEWVDYHALDLPRVIKDDHIAIYVDDPSTSDGKAIWINPKEDDWVIQKKFSGLLMDKSINAADVYLTYKVNPNQSAEVKNAVSIGVYDVTTKTYPFSKKLKSDSTPNGYTTVKVGEIDFSKVSANSYLYISGQENDAATDIFIDRVFLVLK